MSNSEYNSKLDKRTFEINKSSHKYNIDRLLLERDSLSGTDTRIQDSQYNTARTYVNKSKTGEITGEDFDISTIDHGMPLRSQYKPRRNEDQSSIKSYNKYMDFNIYDEDQQTNKPSEVNYFDPENNSLFNFSDMTKTSPQLKKTDPISILSHIHNDFNWFIFENLKQTFQSTPNISLFNTYGIVNLMSSLYLASKSNTEYEIKTYFNFNDKELVHSASIQLKQYIDKSQCLDWLDIMLINKDIPINKEFINYIKPYITCFTVDKRNPKQEAVKLNTYINSKFNNIFGPIFNSDHINKLELSLLTVGILRPVWKNNFDKVVKSSYGQPDMMVSHNKIYNYYSDDDCKIIELDMYDNILTMGIIMGNTNNYQDYITKLKPELITELAIPKFTQQVKMRANTILQKTGLSEVFNKIDIPELLGEQTLISDLVQNYIIIVEEVSKSHNKPVSKAKQNKNIKFIANEPFTFYIRSIATDNIVLIGCYN
jgi:serine protease inhibitor